MTAEENREWMQHNYPNVKMVVIAEDGSITEEADPHIILKAYAQQTQQKPLTDEEIDFFVEEKFSHEIAAAYANNEYNLVKYNLVKELEATKKIYKAAYKEALNHQPPQKVDFEALQDRFVEETKPTNNGRYTIEEFVSFLNENYLKTKEG